MRNLQSQVVELVQRPRTMLKTLYFIGGHQFFQISEWYKSFMTGVKIFSFIGRGSIIWDRGDNFSKFIYQRTHRGASHRGTWTGCISGIMFQNRWSNEKSVVLSGTSFLKKMVRLYVTISRIYSYVFTGPGHLFWTYLNTPRWHKLWFSV